MSARNSHAAKADRRAERQAKAEEIAKSKVFFPYFRKNRNRYSRIDGAVVDLLEGADLTPVERAPRYVYGRGLAEESVDAEA